VVSLTNLLHLSEHVSRLDLFTKAKTNNTPAPRFGAHFNHKGTKQMATISIKCSFGNAKGVIHAPLYTHRFEETLAFAMRETENIKIHEIGISIREPLTQGAR